MKTGLFSIGLDTYWDQFDGLLDNLNSYHARIHDRIAAMGVDVLTRVWWTTQTKPRQWLTCSSAKT